MAADRTGAVRALLESTIQAHSEFEERHLHGAYDKRWAHWFAEYVVKHGMCNVVGHSLTTEEIEEFLADSAGEFERIDPHPAEPWATYTARRITAEL